MILNGQSHEPHCALGDLTRCGARTRGGGRCERAGNRRNGRCRLHGGNAGAPAGGRNGNYRHGRYSEEFRQERIAIARLLKEAGALLRELR